MYELINELISHREKAKVVPKASVRGNKTSFRQSLRNLAAIENAKVPAERRVSQKAVFAVAERSLQKTAGLEKKTRQFIAYKEVSSFISLACSGELSIESQVSYRDLLPLGHPLSSRYSAMTSSALRHARSRWIAADPRIDDEAREIVAAAYFYDRSSTEYSHAIASLQVLVAGGVPREIYLSALTAAFSFGSGNSSAARSARANLQWRDRLGRWIEMGRGIGFKININGNNVPINGKFIGVDGKRGLVQVKGDPNLPDGIYPVESSNAQEYKALLPDSVVGKLKGKLSSIFDSRAQIFSKEDMIKMRMDAPAGWKKNKDGSFGSDDDYIVEESDGKLTLFRKDKNGDKGAQVGEQVDDWAQIQDLANADEEDYDKFKRIMSAPSNADVLPGSEKDPYDNLNPSAKAVLEEQAAKKAADKAFFTEKKKKYNEDVDKFEAMFEQGKDIEGRDIPEGWELGISKYSTDGVLDIRSFQKLVPSADGKNQIQVIAEIDDEGKISFGHRAQWFNKNENGTGKYDTWEEAEAQIPRVVEWVGDAKSLQHDPADPWFKETIPVPRPGDDESAKIFDFRDNEDPLEFPTLFDPDKPSEEADDWVGVDPARLAKLNEDIKALEEKWAEIDKKKRAEIRAKKKKGPFKNLEKLNELEGIQMLKVKGADGVEIESPVAEFSDRPMVLVNINGVRIPFYISTGMGGKKDVAVGEWYPIFGIKDGWFNKGNQDDINDYYESPELKEVAQWLNSNIGDIRRENIPQIAEADEEEFAEQQLNRDLSPVGYGYNPFLNIREAVARISGDEERIAEVEEMKAIKKEDDGLEQVRKIEAKIAAEEKAKATAGEDKPQAEQVTDVVTKLTPPAGAWKLQSPDKFEPEGRVDDEMSPDFSDDPEVLANKFSEDALVDAFIQAIVGKKDYALDLLEDSSEDDEDVEVDEDGEPVAKKEKKGKPGPKKKKPEQKPVGYGNGALDFNQGEEWVPAEALYLALKNQGYDVDLLLAQLYDTGLGESKNQDLLKSLRKEENVQAETPLLDAIDPEDAEAIARANVEVASVDASSAVVAQVLELNRNGEPNPAIVQLAAKIAKAKGAAVNDIDSGLSDDLQALLNEYIVGALDPDAAPEDKQAFQALWGMIMSLDEGVSDGIEETKLANGVFDALTKYYGDAEWSDVKEFWDKNGGINALIRSKKALVDGKESIDSDTSFAGAYYRLMAESARYNQETLYRGIQVPLDSPLLARLKAGGLLTFDARSFSTDRNVAAIQFGGAMNAVGDKAAVIFNIKPLKSKASDLTSVSPFNEREHKVIGNFKVVGVKQTKSPQGKITYEVEIEMVSKRDAVLDGLDTSYENLLMKENASPEMPEGYHKIDPARYESRAEQDFPDDFEDKPDAVARSYDRDVLAESFRQAIENGSGEVILEWDNEKEVTVAVELIRDALQIQGVDTNALLDDIANADPEAQASDEEAEPVEQSVDNPVNAIVEDVSQEYDMEGWKKVGPQLGSNEGGFYEDAEGNRFYVKKPKSDLHAENEVLAAALYKLLGIDAAEIGIGSGEDGVKMTFSPDIIGSKQDLQEKLNDPAYLAKLQEGFAVDAWLANWDVAGLGFDNVMSDGSGNPVRVDPGGALLFRAMGKPKGSLFGNEVNELDTLRDPSMNPQSAAVFGSMTDEQQKESARKLLAISNDDIDSMVDGIVTDPEAGQEIKDKLKARRQFILERYDLLSEDTSVVVDNADISKEQDADPEAVSTPEGKSAEVDSRLDNARSWAEEYALDENMLASARKKFQAVADQIDKVLVDWRNGEISDEELPGVIGELRDLADFGKIGDDIALLNNIDDIDQQLMSLQEYIEEENKKNAPEPAVGEAPVEAPEPVATESVTNPYKDKNGTPIEPGAKIRYEKKGVVLEGVFSRYDKNTGYVWVKMPDGKKPVVFSTKYLTVIDGDDGGGGEGPKAPEAPESPEPEAPETPETPTPDVAPDEDIEPELDTPQEDIGQFEPTAQLTEDGKKVRVSFTVDGNRPFNPKGDGPAGYEEVLPYVVDSKLDVDGVDEVTVEIPLDKMDDFAKDYRSVFDEKLIPEEFYGDIYTDYQEPKKLNLYAQNIKDILKKQGTEISDEKAIEIRDAIEENDLIEKWSSATDEDIASAILDVVGPGIVDLVDEDIDAGDADEEPPAAAKPSPSTPFPDEPILNEAANELVKLFSYGMPDGGKILAVHEKDGMIAATPDGETVYIIDAKKKTNYTPEAKPVFFEPGGNGVEVFQWRQPTKEENDALLEKIAQNKSEPFGTESEPIEDVDATDELEVPDGFTAIADSTGNQIFAGVKVADKDGVIGTVLKVNKDNYAFVDFGNGVVKWRSGKTLKSTNTLDENFKGPTAKKSTTKATGAGAEPVIVDSPANWSLSNFEEVPALPDAIAKALDTSDKKAAMRGASAAVDADSIEDLDVRVMHVRNAEGADGIQLKFKLTNWAGKKKVAEIASMTEQERIDAGIEVSKLRIPRITIGKDGVGDLSASEYAYESPAGRTYKITTKDGIVITIHRANQDSSDTFTKGYGGVPARAFHNTVQIQAPVGATDDQIANALALAGVSQVRPATPADAKVLIENRLMSIFDAKTDANTNPKGEARVESLQKVKDKWGLTVDDVVVTTGPSGRIEYRLSEEGAKKIWEATGKPEALSHGLRHPGVLDYNMSNEQKVKAMTDWLVGFIDNPQGGLLSTTTRWTEGIGISGQSSTADIGTGGADYVFTRPTKSADRKRYGTTDWLPTLYFDPLKAYQRLDFYANYTDAFGKRSKNKDIISAAQVGAYEVMFKQRLSWDDLDVMVVSKDMHQGVIEGLKARGINYIGGRPIEEVIITGTGESKS
jgi:hypothetical protein